MGLSNIPAVLNLIPVVCSFFVNFSKDGLQCLHPAMFIYLNSYVTKFYQRCDFFNNLLSVKCLQACVNMKLRLEAFTQMETLYTVARETFPEE